MELENENFSEKAKRDFQLIQKAKDGNTRAYAELLDYYKEPLYFMLFKMVNNKEDAEDLTLETFEKAFRNLTSYTPIFAFSTWLFKIATNCGIDFIRSQRNRARRLSIHPSGMTNELGDITHATFEELSPNPEEHFIEKQQHNLVLELIKRLPPDYRRILTLRFFEELSYVEISENLNIPIGTVKTRIFRSRELLQSMFKQVESKQ